jgi:hypothetical protein
MERESIVNVRLVVAVGFIVICVFAVALLGLSA